MIWTDAGAVRDREEIAVAEGIESVYSYNVVGVQEKGVEKVKEPLAYHDHDDFENWHGQLQDLTSDPIE